MPQDEKATVSEKGDRDALVQYTLQLVHEGNEARRDRMRLNEVNRDAYHNKQDWSHKIEGQSHEFLPKTSVTVEQFTAFIKRGLVQFGRWFSVDVEGLDGNALTKFLEAEFDALEGPEGNTLPIELRLADGVKTGLLETPVVFKVHGEERERDEWRIGDDGEPERTGRREWRLCIDLLKPENVIRDPFGRGLYTIHEDEFDLSDIQALSEGEDPIYDPEVVAKLGETHVRVEREHEARRRHSSQKRDASPAKRRTVKITEVWGTILDDEGAVARGPVRGMEGDQPLRKVLWAIANDTHVIRKPEPWPYWHGRDPFVFMDLLNVPFSMINKALYDQVVPLNHALNELYNLILDGGLASVWGIREIRTAFLEDPTQVSDGIPQGATLVLNDNVPSGQSALSVVQGGQIPNDALQVYNLTDREFEVSALTSDLKMGLLPPKDIKATALTLANEAQSVMLDSIVFDLERGIGSIIRKALLTLIQNLDNADMMRVIRHFSDRAALDLLQLSPAQRFVQFTRSRVKVFGLSATLARARDFQRLMAVLQIVAQNPLMMRAFMKRYSSDKLLQKAFKLLNVNPEDFERSPEELQQLPTEFQEVMQLFQATQSPRSGNATGTFSSPSGEAGLQSDINQQAAPTELT